MNLTEAKRMVRQAGSYTGQNESSELVISELERLEQELAKSSLADHRITIEVSGGMVQNVYTTLDTEIEVDILDFDDNSTRSDKEREDMQIYLRRAISEQRQIY